MIVCSLRIELSVLCVVLQISSLGDGETSDKVCMNVASLEIVIIFCDPNTVKYDFSVH